MKVDRLSLLSAVMSGMTLVLVSAIFVQSNYWPLPARNTSADIIRAAANLAPAAPDPITPNANPGLRLQIIIKFNQKYGPTSNWIFTVVPNPVLPCITEYTFTFDGFDSTGNPASFSGSLCVTATQLQYWINIGKVPFPYFFDLVPPKPKVLPFGA